jgi:hypothetical protein
MSETTRPVTESASPPAGGPPPPERPFVERFILPVILAAIAAGGAVAVAIINKATGPAPPASSEAISSKPSAIFPSSPLLLPPAAVTSLAAPTAIVQSNPRVTANASTWVAEKFAPSKVLDGDRQTAWNSSTGDLLGSWIQLNFDPALPISQLGVTPGFAWDSSTNGDLWTKNYRIIRATVTTSDGRRVPVRFDPNRREVQFSELGPRKPVTWVRLTIDEALPGSLATAREKPWREICISDIQWR